jgi:X-Pro dipeptidyl-peptidase
VKLRLTKGGRAHGGLSPNAAPGQGVESLVDNVEFSGAVLAKLETTQTGQAANRLVYTTPELVAPVHMSGYSKITLRLASSKKAANVSVWLVQLPWADGPIGPANLITRGWADPQNHASLTEGGDYHSKARGEPLVPARFYDMTFSLEPDDQIIPAGKRIGLMILASDRDFTLWPQPGTELTIDLDGTTLQIPVVGGPAAYKTATGEK